MCIRKKQLANPNNENVNSFLWLQEDGTLFKEYFIFDERTIKNIKNVKFFGNRLVRWRLSGIPELVLPQKLITNDSKGIVGYIMDYYPGGRTLYECLGDSQFRNQYKKDILIQLGNVILKLPRDIYVGDLHGRNVLVDSDNRIHLIDIDGFSRKSNQISCPLSHMNSYFLLRKYFKGNALQISRNTDIFCFLSFVMEWISGVNMFWCYTVYEISRYLDYLDVCNIGRAFTEMIRRLFQEGDNYIDLCSIKNIAIEQMGQYRYSAFCEWQD